MDHHKAGREAFLKELREQSASLAEEIIKKETLLFRSLDSLQYLLQHLDSLPWHSLTPDTFSLAGKRMRLEFKDQEVNRVFSGRVTLPWPGCPCTAHRACFLFPERLPPEPQALILK